MSEREWFFYIDDMLCFSENVMVYCEELSFEDFINTGLNYDATVRNLELIGESANQIPEEIQAKYKNDIPWRQLISTRNRLIHGYLGIDNDILWSIIQEDIPELILNLKKLKFDLKHNK